MLDSSMNVFPCKYESMEKDRVNREIDKLSKKYDDRVNRIEQRTSTDIAYVGNGRSYKIGAILGSISGVIIMGVIGPIIAFGATENETIGVIIYLFIAAIGIGIIIFGICWTVSGIKQNNWAVYEKKNNYIREGESDKKKAKEEFDEMKNKLIVDRDEKIKNQKELFERAVKELSGDFAENDDIELLAEWLANLFDIEEDNATENYVSINFEFLVSNEKIQVLNTKKSALLNQAYDFRENGKALLVGDIEKAAFSNTLGLLTETTIRANKGFTSEMEKSFEYGPYDVKVCINYKGLNKNYKPTESWI